jgi:beta-lactamase regulating signal transducer with metallopeptidase domain/HEAT repeat protein/protein involved in polysaccharide export with SLBB domain
VTFSTPNPNTAPSVTEVKKVSPYTAAADESMTIAPIREPKNDESVGGRRIVLLSIGMLWAGGVLLFVIRWMVGGFILRRLRRTALPLTDASVEMLKRCAAELELDRHVRLASHPRVRSPMTLGLWRPIIFVPTTWPQLSSTAQRSSLSHELAHVSRYDDWLALPLELIRAVFWFHPLVRWLLARIECERELRCDETAVRQGIDPRQYAAVLLDFARQPGRLLPAPLSIPAYPLRFGRRRTVRARIEHLLEENMQRWITPLSRGRAVALATTTLAFAAVIGCVRVQSEEDPQPKKTEKAPQATRAVPNPPATGVTPKPPTTQARPKPPATTVAPKTSPTRPPAEPVRDERPTTGSNTKSEYRIKPFDVLHIRGAGAQGVLDRLRVYGNFLVAPNGEVWLGEFYVPVPLGDLTLSEATVAVEKVLVKVVDDCKPVSVQLAGRVNKWINDPARQHPYRIQVGHELEIKLRNNQVLDRLQIPSGLKVDSDGTVNLGEFYGTIKLAGLTFEEATAAVKKQVAKVVDEPVVTVSISGWEKDWQRLELVTDPDSKSALPRIPKEDLRYDGKSFDQWRRELLTELKPEKRVEGISAMAEFGANGYGEEAILVIGEIMKGLDMDFPSTLRVRTPFPDAITRIGPAAAAPLIRFLKNPDPKVRYFAASSIRSISPSVKDAIPSLITLLDDDDPNIRAEAIRSAMAIDFESPDVQKAFAKAVKDPSPMVRRSAVQYFPAQSPGARSAFPILLELLKSDDNETRGYVIEKLRQLGRAALPAVPGLLEAAKKDQNQAGNAVSAMQAIEADKSRLANILVELMVHERPLQHGGDYQALNNTNALHNLRKMGAEAKGAVPALIKLLSSDDEMIQRLAIDVLRHIGPEAKQAIPELTRLSQFSAVKPPVRSAAGIALKRIAEQKGD